MKKNKLLTILATTTLIVGLSACSSKNAPSNETKPTDTPTTEVVTPTTGAKTPTPAVDASNTETTPTSEAPSTENTITSDYQEFGTLDDQYSFVATYVNMYTSIEEATEGIETYAKEHNLSTYEVADGDGLECYVVIPKFEGTSIKIDKFTDFDEANIEPITETQKPVFILCNPSDIFANTQITVISNDKTTVFSPYISLKDGSVVLPEEANQNVE